MLRRPLATALAALTLASGGLAARAAATDPAPQTSTGAEEQGSQTPVLSARRVPALLRRTAGDERLRADLDAALADPALGGATSASCLVVRHLGRTTYSRRPELALLPASTLKVLTAAAALEALGPESRLTTEVRAGGPPAAGVIDGPLWFVGGGDPLLATSDYLATFVNQPQPHTSVEALADAVVAAGVREVRGGVLGDGTRFDAVRTVPSWKPTYLSDGEVGPIGGLLVNDGFAQIRPRRVPAGDPAAHAAAVLAQLLRDRGVAVSGSVGAGAVPDGSDTHLVAAIQSLPIDEIVGEMLRESDNTTAEVLVKEIGRERGAGDWPTGLRAVREALADDGLPAEDLTAVDGSGLDRSDRASCRLVQGALEEAGTDGPIAEGLAVAGRTGTLSRRFTGHPAAGRLRAKTGSLSGVTGLTGFVDIDGDEPLAFTLLANDLPRDAVGRALQERVAAILVAYPKAPPMSELAPPDSEPGTPSAAAPAG